ncbi:Survival motor neuron protein, partial [Thalictrum thalictroides]
MSSSKQADPWDDSALLNAFDHAITKYKKMHKKERFESSIEGETVVTGSSEALCTPDVLEETPLTTTSSLKDAGDAYDSLLVEENHQTDSHPQEPHKQTSNGTHMQETLEEYIDSQGLDAHNELLKQYYELEEQRQKVLQQLQQAGYWNNQYSGDLQDPSGQWGTCSAQEHQDFNGQASHPTVVSYCSPCVCPCLVTPCLSMPPCSLGGACFGKKDTAGTPITCTSGPGKLSSLDDDTIVKTAMGAAERAISSMNLKASSSYTKPE